MLASSPVSMSVMWRPPNQKMPFEPFPMPHLQASDRATNRVGSCCRVKAGCARAPKGRGRPPPDGGALRPLPERWWWVAWPGAVTSSRQQRGSGGLWLQLRMGLSDRLTFRMGFDGLRPHRGSTVQLDHHNNNTPQL